MKVPTQKKAKKKLLIRRFTDDLYIRIYKLAKTGMKKDEMADSLGVARTLFSKWVRNNLEVKRAIEQGRAETKEKDQVAKSYKKYIYDSLPKNLRKTWDKVIGFYHENATSRIERMLADKGDKERQSLFLHALVHFSYNPSKAMKAVQISRKELDRWKTDTEFAELLNEIDEHKIGFLEGALFEQVEEGSLPAVIFGLKHLAPKFANKPKVSVVQGKVEHDHQHKHTVHDAIAALPKEQQILLLEGLQAAERKQLPARREPLEVK